MSEYRQPYLVLWAGITKAREELEQRNYGYADDLLKQAQQKAEEAFVNYPEDSPQEG